MRAADQEAERNRGGGGDGRYSYCDGINWWEDTVANVILRMEPNHPLAYTPGLELHHPIMSTLRDPGGRLERERERDTTLLEVELLIKYINFHDFCHRCYKDGPYFLFGKLSIRDIKDEPYFPGKPQFHVNKK